ncbi:SAM-dependent methyltransferase [Nitrogeniibacter mangrovi]|uniref:SAM-dependent methyltransferase n=1 Tax=Nitrogeniibacter mangrovi TaxID=2016596 RepID=A0A6C1B683_9RHOO|nr:SAM-dependent methyltransferase [Nitrogeniibacter mangrovi]QID17754.1 SAM-dependent methyltransferase [Nitrogeniibacter mangrovi]
MTQRQHGTLYLVPVSLGTSPLERTLPSAAAETIRGLRHFVVENPKAARAELKRIAHPTPLRELSIEALPNQPDVRALEALLAPALAGNDLGLMSDAGVPAVADPGALLVREAHRLGLRVVPLVGPSSLLLGLMASGLDGQRFAFHGYLPVKDNERAAAIRALEAESRHKHQTQLFIETPYRNAQMFQTLLATAAPGTRLCVARGLTTAEEWVQTHRIDAWKRRPAPALERIPTVFLLLAD